jgi:hypothetical protein
MSSMIYSSSIHDLFDIILEGISSSLLDILHESKEGITFLQGPIDEHKEFLIVHANTDHLIRFRKLFLYVYNARCDSFIFQNTYH